MTQTILIVANPYDAEVLRRAVVSGGFAAAIQTSEAIPTTDAAAALVSTRLSFREPAGMIGDIRSAMGAIPIVLLSQSGSPYATLAAARELGADHLLLRPIEPELVVAKFERFLGVEPEERAAPTVGPSAPVTPPRGVKPDHLGASPPTASQAGGAMALPPTRGELFGQDVARLFWTLYTTGFGGALELRRDSCRKVIYFDGGCPVEAESTEFFDRLGQLAIREGYLTPAELDVAQERARRQRRPIGALLVELELISDDVRFALLRQRALEIVYSVFNWRSGSYELRPASSVPGTRLDLRKHPAAIVVEGIQRKYTLDRLQAQLGGNSVVIIFEPERSPLIDQLDLDGEDGALIDALAADPQPIAALAATAERETRALQLIYGLLVIGAVRIDDSGAAGPTSPAVLSVCAVRRRIEAKHAQVIEGDYFTLLGVAPTAGSREIAHAHAKMTELFDERRLPDGLSEELAAELDAIRAVINESYRVLSDEDLRRRYRGNLLSSQR